MVDPNTHTEGDEVSGDKGAHLQIPPWKHQRDLEHDERIHGHPNG